MSSIFAISQLLMLGLLILGLILISVPPSLNLRKRAGFVVVGFCILFLVLGIWRHQIAETQISKSKLQMYNDKKETVVLLGIVMAEPDIGEKSQKLTVEIKQLHYAAGSRNNKGAPNYAAGSRNVEEKVLVTAKRYPEYQYGDKLKITGKLETPPVFEGFNYQQYLQKEGIYSVISWPEIELLERENYGSPISVIYAKTLKFKNKFQEVSRSFISPPQEGILEALIFGDESEVPKELKDKLNLTGTRHIAAVSGMNITIISSLILSFLLSLGLWRQQAFYISIFLLSLYILMIGAPSSALRAGIMGGFLMAAQYFGRLSAASRAVTLAAASMLLINPLLLKLDVGFQLSFLAILGIIYLQPTFSDWLKILPNPKFFPLKTTLATTLAAQIFTLPILIYNFGYIPVISPITNILIVPFLAPITILVFIFGLSGMVFEPLGFVLSLPAWLSMVYIVEIINWFSKLSWASLSFQNINWIWPAISYLILGLATWRLQEKQKLKLLNY